MDLDTNETISHSRISKVLYDFVSSFEGERVSLEELKNSLRDRAFGILMFLFAAPNLIPTMIPGISTILGVPLILLSWQLMRGRKAPWFPKWLNNRTIKHSDLDRILDYSLPYLKKIEHYLKPRLEWLVNNPVERLIAFLCFIMAILLALPIPLGNWMPALAICLFSIAILERDGVFSLLGFVAAIISLFVVSSVVIIFIKLLLFSLANLFS